MAKYIYNNTDSLIIVHGQEIESHAYYLLQPEEEKAWGDDTSVLHKIIDETIIVSTGMDCCCHIPDKSTAINCMKNLQPTDSDGRVLVRPIVSVAGWTYQMFVMEFKTSDLDSLYCKKYDGTTRNYITYKIYDEDDVEITSAENEDDAVKTVINFEPPHDYEIIGGQIQQLSKPVNPLRIWIVAVPDVPENYGGCKEMIAGVNLQYIDPVDKVTADGRAVKYMKYDENYHTNKLSLIIRHDSGLKHDLMYVLEYFRP